MAAANNGAKDKEGVADPEHRSFEVIQGNPCPVRALHEADLATKMIALDDKDKKWYVKDSTKLCTMSKETVVEWELREGNRNTFKHLIAPIVNSPDSLPELVSFKSDLELASADEKIHDEYFAEGKPLETFIDGLEHKLSLIRRKKFKRPDGVGSLLKYTKKVAKETIPKKEVEQEEEKKTTVGAHTPVKDGVLGQSLFPSGIQLYQVPEGQSKLKNTLQPFCDLAYSKEGRMRVQNVTMLTAIQNPLTLAIQCTYRPHLATTVGRCLTDHVSAEKATFDHLSQRAQIAILNKSAMEYEARDVRPLSLIMGATMMLVIDQHLHKFTFFQYVSFFHCLMTGGDISRYQNLEDFGSAAARSYITNMDEETKKVTFNMEPATEPKAVEAEDELAKKRFAPDPMMEGMMTLLGTMNQTATQLAGKLKGGKPPKGANAKICARCGHEGHGFKACPNEAHAKYDENKPLNLLGQFRSGSLAAVKI